MNKLDNALQAAIGARDAAQAAVDAIEGTRTKRSRQVIDLLVINGVNPKVYAAAWLFMQPEKTQADCADHLGVNCKTISRWKRDGFDLKNHIRSMGEGR